MARKIAEFVSANAGTMDPTIMADQIKREVRAQYPHALGIGRQCILRHLREHVLLPHVRMASIVRSLIALAESLRGTLHQIDEDTGEFMVDIRNTELYLKVINQIHNVYKTDGSRMLFSNGTGSGSSGGSSVHGTHGGSPPAPVGPSGAPGRH
jgi:hypothetical protein